MRTFNRIELIGHAGTDPQVKTTTGGTRVASLTLATNRSNDEATVDWHRLTFWDKLAGLAEQYVRKGDPLWVEGQVRYSTSGDGEQKRYWTEVVVTRVIFLGARREVA